MNLVWHKTDTDIAAQYASRVAEEMSAIPVETPSKLVFHHIFLNNDYDGPCIFVWGEKGDDDNFHCEYVANVEWTDSVYDESGKLIDT